MERQDQTRQDTNQREQLVAGLVGHFGRVMREHRESTMQFGDVFVRASHHTWAAAGEGDDRGATQVGLEAYLRDALLIQLQGYEALPGPGEVWAPLSDPFFDREQQQALWEWGFHAPESLLPNWWRDVATDAQVSDAADATVGVLTEVCGVPLAVVAADAPFLDPLEGGLPVLPRRFEPTTASAESTVIADPAQVVAEYEAHVLLRHWQDRRFWPEASNVEPAWFVIVDEVSRAQRILEIVALAPLGPGEEQVGWHRRTARGWVADPTVARRLARVTTEALVTVSAETVSEIEDGWRW